MYVSGICALLHVFGPKLAQIFRQGNAGLTITSLGRDDHRDGAAHVRDRAHAGRRPRCGCGCGAIPLGELSEVVTRSDCVMSGYWNNPEASADALRGGWLHWGPRGMDQRSYHAQDRAEDAE
jgi:long-chain acyl-CoA synthetase